MAIAFHKFVNSFLKPPKPKRTIEYRSQKLSEIARL